MKLLRKPFAWVTQNVSVWLVIAIFSALLVGMGGLMLVDRARLTDFIDCQANYNEEENEARFPRLQANAEENETFYAWLATLPPLLAVPEGEEPDPELVKQFRRTLREAIRAHEKRLRVEAKNPYPDSPAETCGGSNV